MENIRADDLMTITEAMKLKGVGAGAIYYAIKHGAITRVWLYGKPFLVRKTVEAYQPRVYRSKRLR